MQVSRWVPALRSGVRDAAPRPGHAAEPVSGCDSSLLRHDAERRIGAGGDDIVGFYQTLREADRAAGLDHVWLDGEPLSDLSRADEIDRHPIVTSEDTPPI
jgi:hypothetical protein